MHLKILASPLAGLSESLGRRQFSLDARGKPFHPYNPYPSFFQCITSDIGIEQLCLYNPGSSKPESS